VRRELQQQHSALYGEQQIVQFTDPVLTENVVSITVVDLPQDQQVREDRFGVDITTFQLQRHFHMCILTFMHTMHTCIHMYKRTLSFIQFVKVCMFVYL